MLARLIICLITALDLRPLIYKSSPFFVRLYVQLAFARWLGISWYILLTSTYIILQNRLESAKRVLSVAHYIIVRSTVGYFAVMEWTQPFRPNGDHQESLVISTEFIRTCARQAVCVCRRIQRITWTFEALTAAYAYCWLIHTYTGCSKRYDQRLVIATTTLFFYSFHYQY